MTALAGHSISKRLRKSFHKADQLAQWAFVVAVAAISLQWIPAIPIEGAQVSDLLVLLSAVALVVSGRKIVRLPTADVIWLVCFAGGVAVSALVNGGSYTKLLGHFELVVVLLLATTFAQDQNLAIRIKQALIVAAIIGAITGLIGAILYFLGSETSLLNHFGDLQPGNYPRIRGTCLKANMLATVLATGLILLQGEHKSSWFGRYRVPIAILLGLALLFTFSRTWLSLGAGLLAVSALSKPTRVRHWIAVSAVVVVAALLVISARFTIQVEPTHFWQATIISEPGTRWTIWGQALHTAIANPIFGAGPGSPATSSGWSAHLVWLNLWAVLGLLPLCSFAFGIYRTLRKYRQDVFVAVALGVIVLDGLARDVEDMRHLWVLLGLLLARSGSGREV